MSKQYLALEHTRDPKNNPLIAARTSGFDRFSYPEHSFAGALELPPEYFKRVLPSENENGFFNAPFLRYVFENGDGFLPEVIMGNAERKVTKRLEETGDGAWLDESDIQMRIDHEIDNLPFRVDAYYATLQRHDNGRGVQKNKLELPYIILVPKGSYPKDIIAMSLMDWEVSKRYNLHKITELLRDTGTRAVSEVQYAGTLGLHYASLFERTMGPIRKDGIVIEHPKLKPEIFLEPNLDSVKRLNE